MENSEISNFPYEKEIKINSKGYCQISIKMKSDKNIDNKALVSDFEALKKEAIKKGFKIEEIKK